MAIAQAGAALQAPVPSQRPAAVLFQPLLADPKEPRFFATYLWTRSPRLASRLGSAGLPDDRAVAGARLAARNRRGGVSRVQHAILDDRSAEHRLPRRSAPPLP